MARKNVTEVFEAFLNNETKLGVSISCQCDKKKGSRVIFSYAMPIAKILFNRRIEIVDRSKSPSVTTSGHISGVSQLAVAADFEIVTAQEIV